MAVQHAEAPRGQHEQPGAGKQDADELDRQLALLAVNPGAISRDEQRRGQHADEHEHRDDERSSDATRAGHAVGLHGARRARRATRRRE